jgi:hypothetical protein
MDVPFATVKAVEDVVSTILAGAKTQKEEITAAVREKF